MSLARFVGRTFCPTHDLSSAALGDANPKLIATRSNSTRRRREYMECSLAGQVNVTNQWTAKYCRDTRVAGGRQLSFLRPIPSAQSATSVTVPQGAENEKN